MKLKVILVAAGICLMVGPAMAGCVGTDAFQSCFDGSGNNYTVSRFGNMMTMQGSNADGSSWSQTSNHLGNSVYTNGETNGRSWNETQTTTGFGTTTYGTDSHGQSFYQTCNQFGCY